ncbi:MAG: 50S ribosomal protein L4 [Rhodothermales bacterium]
MEAKVYRQDGSEAGRNAELDAAVFGIEPNDHVIWLDVRRIQANGRQGTHKAKERSEVAGSTRKLYRQKGTGFARAGSAKSPVRRSGGTIFGPRPRDYSLKVNRKTQLLARRSAFAYKAQQDAVRVIESLAMDTISARTVSGLLKQLGAEGSRVLFLTAEHNVNLYRSSRNVPRVVVRAARDASTIDVMQASVVLVEEGALPVISEVLVSGPVSMAG